MFFGFAKQTPLKHSFEHIAEMEATVLSKRRKRRKRRSNRNPNIAISSPSPTITEMQQSTETLTPQSRHAPPLPTLPFELVAEILCRLPVKLLLQLRCLCKSFNSLISDPKFAKKHLHSSTTPHHLILRSNNGSGRFALIVSPIQSVLSTSTVPVPQTQLSYPTCLTEEFASPYNWCSCDGIICLTTDYSSAVLWNPFINKFKTLPPLKYISLKRTPSSLFTFGYDPFADNYKVFAITFCVKRTTVEVHTMGTSSWRRIEDFPSWSFIPNSGIFVAGYVHWLTYDGPGSQREIVSLDLEDESYCEVLPPDLETDLWTLGSAWDHLCIFASNELFMDVWIMEEYGKKESWTKLCKVPYLEDQSLRLRAFYKAFYLSEDGQVVLDAFVPLKLAVYDSKTDALKIREIQNRNGWTDPKVYTESLISPCS